MELRQDAPLNPSTQPILLSSTSSLNKPSSSPTSLLCFHSPYHLEPTVHNLHDLHGNEPNPKNPHHSSLSLLHLPFPFSFLLLSRSVLYVDFVLFFLVQFCFSLCRFSFFRFSVWCRLGAGLGGRRGRRRENEWKWKPCCIFERVRERRRVCRWGS